VAVHRARDSGSKNCGSEFIRDKQSPIAAKAAPT
jgi:hypothetical protein